jgi:tetratricopeptide (TPR) repeat protein
VASFVPQRHTLHLAERAYSLCAALGPDSLDALAFLLGHELAHYYANHGWVGDFGQQNADLEVGQALQEYSAIRKIEVETEADYFGGFFGYVAGYRTLEVVPQLLTSIYAAYGLQENLEGYPSLAERQQIAQRSAEKVQLMIPVFEAGHRLLLLRQYSAAAQCFDHLSLTFPSREMLNNAGVARALRALSLFESDALWLAYPFELDAATRLQDGRKAGMTESSQETRNRLLKEARERFEQASRKDPNYAPAWINLACVADLQGEPEEALVWARKAQKITQGTDEVISLAHAHIIRGIARTHIEPVNLEDVRQDFEAARTGDPTLAALNLAALDNKDAPQTRAESSDAAAPKNHRERIDGLSPENYAALMDGAPAVSLPGQSSLTIYPRQTSSWESLVVTTPFSDIVILATKPTYAGATEQGVRLGATRRQVLEAYGKPSYQIAGRQGTYHVYSHPGIIFHTEADDRVQQWLLYRIEE